MAEKGFGVKEVNLIGASGTPTITSPNNLNLNANNVAISTNVSIGGTLSVTGNISVGGTLTYEDVTNIDSVGIVTARDGVVVVGRGVSIAAGGLNVTAGISTLSGIVKIMSGLDLQTNGTLDIIGSSSSSGLDIQSNASVQIGQAGFPNNDYATFTNTGVNLYYNGSSKLTTTNTGVNVTGAITVNGSALSITPTTSDIQIVYEITNQTSNSYYRFAGNGVDSSANNPDIYLTRGQKYRFINNSGGNHPFRIQSDASTAYNTGVTNNNASSGNIDFIPNFDAPAQLVYQCSNHGGMVGNIYLRGGNGNENNVGVITATHFSSNSGTTIQRQFKYLTNTSQLTKGGSIGELNTNLRIPFTPKFANSNLLMEFDTSYVSPNTTNLYYCLFYDVTNSAGVSLPAAAGSRVRCHWTKRTSPNDNNDNDHLSMRIVTPANNTTARQYTIHFGSEGATAQFFVSTLSSSAGTTYPMTFTITEIAA